MKTNLKYLKDSVHTVH